MKLKDALKQNIQAYTNHIVFADRMSIFSENGSYTCFMLFAVYFLAQETIPRCASLVKVSLNITEQSCKQII